MKQKLAILFVILSLFSAAGAGCPSMTRPNPLSIPPALPPSASLEQVMTVVNRNSQLIHSFSSDQAEISASGAPTLRANIAMTRPHNFRLQAGTIVTGPELDLGSNDQYFWFWVRRDDSNAVYYCEHDQFEGSSLRHNMPVSPKELVEAFGLVEFDPMLPHHGPTKRADGNLEVRTVFQAPSGQLTRVVVVHAAYGWVLEQALYDSREQLLMHAKAQNHRRDPLTGLVMPKVVVINMPTNQLKMRVNLGNVAINTLNAPNPELWTIPVIQGTTTVNIGCPGGGSFPPAQTSSTPSPVYSGGGFSEEPYRTPSVPTLGEVEF